MKKILILIILLVLTGCNDMMNTPTKRVEELLYKYQTFNKQIEEELKTSLTNTTMTKEENDLYIKAMKRQFNNLTYEIKEELIDGNVAVVKTEVKVYNFANALNSDKTTIQKINTLLKETKKKTYQLTINLSNVDDIWVIDGLSEEVKLKLQGLYTN